MGGTTTREWAGRMVTLLLTFVILIGVLIAMTFRKPDSETVELQAGDLKFDRDRQQLLLNNRPYLFASALFHYNRYPSTRWPILLHNAKAAGFDAVTVEVAEGFGEFVDLIKKSSLQAVVRLPLRNQIDCSTLFDRELLMENNGPIIAVEVEEPRRKWRSCTHRTNYFIRLKHRLAFCLRSKNLLTSIISNYAFSRTCEIASTFSRHSEFRMQTVEAEQPSINLIRELYRFYNRNISFTFDSFTADPLQVNSAGLVEQTGQLTDRFYLVREVMRRLRGSSMKQSWTPIQLNLPKEPTSTLLMRRTGCIHGDANEIRSPPSEISSDLCNDFGSNAVYVAMDSIDQPAVLDLSSFKNNGTLLLNQVAIATFGHGRSNVRVDAALKLTIESSVDMAAVIAVDVYSVE